MSEKKSVTEAIQQLRNEKLKEHEIGKRLIGQGWNEDEVLHGLSPDFRGQDRLAISKRLQRWQWIAIGWLVFFLLMQIAILLLMVSAFKDNVQGISTFVIIYLLFFLVPGSITMIGLIKVQPWAYWLYMVGLLLSTTTVTIDTNFASLLVTYASLAISVAVIIITWKLYSRLFPSRQP